MHLPITPHVTYSFGHKLRVINSFRSWRDGVTAHRATALQVTIARLPQLLVTGAVPAGSAVTKTLLAATGAFGADLTPAAGTGKHSGEDVKHLWRVGLEILHHFECRLFLLGVDVVATNVLLQTVGGLSEEAAFLLADGAAAFVFVAC